ncbi:Sulfite efflux pump SSU1 [Wallemia ichthyophaga EXF-994]|uniref:Sulfite efflux pump SSU1 n=1 Tax=Wallemia ichthyophaga (strain EXF-994 / CBS 113033) TaxID=1299270 RepID=R9AFS9_WALI9|nr:Sulfite efflux pump SSU1 [Wallemia ichthyophaga EXF-994]EOQ98905.1 Sulfite efflux pump SSU1 [Wallemia ichthyophaga EXF-994]
MSRQNVENRQIFATALLPTVSTIVAASTGASVANVLPDSQARITIVISYILLGMGLPISVLLMANYSYRLILFKLPQPAFISSTFITIGPCGHFPIGTLALSAQELGKEMDSTGMKVVGTILMMLLLIIWLLLFPVTLYFSVIKDSWFTSPCLSEVGGQPPSFEEVDFIKNRKY